MGLYDIVGWLATEIGAAAGVGELIDGYPDWGRPNLAPPVGALEIAGWLPGRPDRIGQRQARQTASLRLWLYARSERELAGMLDGLTAWSSPHSRANIGGVDVEIVLQDGNRYTPETPAQQEAHAFALTVAVTW